MYTSFTDWESELYLAHHGVRGQKWGVRNYQNSDGTLTAAGRAHYGVGQGGSKRMARQYNRQMKKLNKLKARADIETQRANAEKYDARAKKAMKVGNTAAGIAGALGLGTHGLGRYINRLGESTNESGHREARRLMEAANEAIKEQDSISNLAKEGAISNKFATKLNNDAFDRYQKQRLDISADERNFRIKQNQKIDVGNVIKQGTKYATYAAAGTAAVSYGVAAVSKLQARAARTRMSEVGHSKAVARVKAQTEKMQKMFADTPYSQLINNQNKPKNNQSKSNNNRNKKRH